MKTKMKMKNNRMLLALVMVAALAMVSVAGVAVISDESDAAPNEFVPDSPNTSGMTVSTTQDAKGNNVYDVYLTSTTTPKMTATFSGTGTINFGGMTTAGVFTAMSTITFADATGHSIVIDAGTDIVTPTINSITVFNTAADSTTPVAQTGTIAVTKGDVTFGGSVQITPDTKAENHSFDGKVTAGAATITSVGVAGTVVSVDATGNASMSGTLTANAETLKTVTMSYKSTLTVDGKIAIGDASANPMTLSVGNGMELIINGDVTMPAAATNGTNTLTVAVGTATTLDKNGKITVNGTINALATVAGKTDAAAAITSGAFGTIQVNGTISGLASLITASSANIKVNAAYYQSGTPASYTYTTLANAMKASSNITITGELFITENTILTGNSTATPVSNKITVAAGSILMIGSGEKYPVVSVPTTTTVTIASAGGITVAGGKLQFEGMKTDVQTNVKAAVFMADATNGTYTDLATALGMAVSGNTVTLRGTADVSTTAEVKAGVILDAKDKAININAGGKLTINGELKGTSAITVSGPTAAGVIPALAAGVLELNNNKIACTSITVTGVLNIGAADLKQVNVPTLTANAGAVINITGKLTAAITGAALATEFTVNVSGSFIGNIATSTVATMNVSGVFTLAVATTVKDVSVTGKVIGTDISMTVSGTMTVGTPSNTLGPSVNNATVKGVTLDTAGKAIVYGTAANVDLKEYDAMKTVFYFGDVVFVTEYAKGAAVAMVIPTVKLKDFNFLGWFDAPVGGMAVTENSGGVIGGTNGGYKSVYGYTTPMQYSLTLTYNQGASWILNGTVQSGVVSLTAGTYDLSVLVNDGYKGDAKITVTGDATYSNGKLTVTGDAAVSVSGVSVKDGGLDITEILLIILVVIIALLAIIVVFKMLRS